MSWMNVPVPRWIAQFRRDRFPLLIVFIAGLGTTHILVRTATYGFAFREGFLAFLAVAKNFLAGEGLRNLWGNPLVGWPPLFPLLLAALDWVGIDPLEGSRWSYAAAFGLTILAAGRWLRSHLRARWLAVAAIAAIAASLPLSHFAAIVSTDFLFAVLTLLALMQLATFLHQGGRTPLLLGAVFTALAAVTRYPGVALIGAGVLMLLVRRTPPLAVRLKDAVVFGAVSSLPLAVVLTRNWVIAGRWTGRHERSGQSLSDGLSQVADVVREWVIPPNALDGLGTLLWIAVGLLGAVGAGVGVVVSGRGLGLDGNTGKARLASPRLGLGPALPFGVFALVYPVFLVAVVPFTVKQGINSRYLLPVYVPLLLVAVVLLDRFLSINVAGRMVAVRSVLASLVLLAFLAHTGFSAYRNLRITDKVYEAGFSRASYWESSEALNYIRTHLREGKIYTNGDGSLLYPAWFRDQTPALGKYYRLPLVGIHKLTARIMRQTEGEGAHIVWFRNEQPLDLDIRCLPGVETVAELSDGVVFRVTATEPFDAKRHHARKQRYVEQLIQQASERVVRAGWDVYRTGRRLIYRKESCAPADVQAQFVLHVVPVDRADLPADRQQFGTESLGFYFFDRRGFWVNDQCMVMAHLPAYAIDRIHIGQWISAEDRTLWEADLEMHRARKQRYVEQLIQQASEHVVRSGWDVYRTGHTLIYRKEPCTSADVQAKFVLHVFPVDRADLPADRQQYASDNLDFYFRDSRRQSPSFRLGDQCIAIAQLPDYPIDRIYIGQWISEEDRTLWEAEFAPGR